MEEKDNKIENKVVLKLDDYLELRDNKIVCDNKLNNLINMLFECLTFNKELGKNGELEFDKYEIRSNLIVSLLKEIDSGRYNSLLAIERLKHKENED